MFSRSLRGTILAALAALMAPLAQGIEVPDTANVAGGDDVLVFQSDDILDDDAIDLVVAPNGDYYAVVCTSSGGNGADLRVFRSTDGGDTWNLFGTKGLAMGQSFLHPELVMVKTPSPRLVLGYVYVDPATNQWSVNVSWSPLGASANWTAMAVLSDAATDFVHFDMTAAEAPAGTILYMAVEESRPSSNDRIWFARSIDQSTSWQAPYVIATPGGSSTLDYQWPRIAGDSVGNVHVVFDVKPQNGSVYDKGVYYRHADNRGVQLADWDAVRVVASANDGHDTRFSSVGCLDAGQILLVSALGDENGGANVVQWTATGDGVSWSNRRTVTADCGFFYANILAHPEGGWVITGTQQSVPNNGFSAWAFGRSPLASPPNWQPTTFFSDQNAQFITHAAVAAIDPTRGNQIALLWTDALGGPTTDYLRFDAQWRDAPGYPSVAEQFPLPGSPVTHPALHEVNPFRPGPELVYGDANGRIHVIDTTTGENVPGWPRQIGQLAWNQSVAVGDIDGNGIFDVIASDGNGDVWAWRGDGELLPGWPVNVGPGKSFVSLGPVSKLASMDVVVATQNSLHLFRPTGVEVTYDYWPRALAHSPVGPASLGDVNADGSLEVVITAANHVSLFGNDGAILWAAGFPAGMVTPTALGDLDANGDLELLIPGGDGVLHARHHDGSVVAGFWPQLTSPGLPIVGLAMAKVDGADGLEVAALNFSGSAYLFRSTGFPFTGFPKMIGGVENYVAAPLLDDVDGGRPELLTADNGGWARGYKENDVDLGGWPKDYGASIIWTPVSGDLDGDGRQQLIFISANSMLKIDVASPAAAPEDTRWAMFAHDAQRTSCAVSSFAGVTPAPEFTQSVVHFAAPSPNPIRGQTVLSFRLPERADVTLEVFDVRGRKVRALIGGTQEAGDHQISWDARDARGERVGQGQYFGRLVVQGQTVNEKLVQRMTVVR